jgi:hypothetical protein
MNSKNSVAEIGIGIICACLPAFNILLTRYVNDNADSELKKLRRPRSEARVAKSKVSTRHVEVGLDDDELFFKTQESEGTQTSVREGTFCTVPADWYSLSEAERDAERAD